MRQTLTSFRVFCRHFLKFARPTTCMFNMHVSAILAASLKPMRLCWLVGGCYQSILLPLRLRLLLASPVPSDGAAPFWASCRRPSATQTASLPTPPSQGASLTGSSSQISQAMDRTNSWPRANSKSSQSSPGAVARGSPTMAPSCSLPSTRRARVEKRLKMGRMAGAARHRQSRASCPRRGASC